MTIHVLRVITSLASFLVVFIFGLIIEFTIGWGKDDPDKIGKVATVLGFIALVVSFFIDFQL